MNLPKVITELLMAQNNFDSVAYANCFSDTAVVFDEGNTHKGKAEIQAWIADANARYQAVTKPVGYEEDGNRAVLTAETSGNFPGSPIVLKYNLETENDLIQSLKITL
jgi:ketosteroid isomerase-like protein